MWPDHGNEKLRTNQIQHLVFLLSGCMANCSLGAVDYCDHGEVSNAVATIRQSTTYTACELDTHLVQYETAAKDFAVVVEALLTVYREFIEASIDDEEAVIKIEEHEKAVDRAKNLPKYPISEDTSSEDLAEPLQEWLSVNEDLFLDLKENVKTIPLDGLSDSDNLQKCESQYYWKIINLWQERLEQCLDTYFEPTQTDSEDSNGSSEVEGSEPSARAK